VILKKYYNCSEGAVGFSESCGGKGEVINGKGKI
jgi:hypothetical protein